MPQLPRAPLSKLCRKVVVEEHAHVMTGFFFYGEIFISLRIAIQRYLVTQKRPICALQDEGSQIGKELFLSGQRNHLCWPNAVWIDTAFVEIHKTIKCDSYALTSLVGLPGTEIKDFVPNLTFCTSCLHEFILAEAFRQSDLKAVELYSQNNQCGRRNAAHNE